MVIKHDWQPIMQLLQYVVWLGISAKQGDTNYATQIDINLRRDYLRG